MCLSIRILGIRHNLKDAFQGEQYTNRYVFVCYVPTLFYRIPKRKIVVWSVLLTTHSVHLPIYYWWQVLFGFVIILCPTPCVGSSAGDSKCFVLLRYKIVDIIVLLLLLLLLLLYTPKMVFVYTTIKYFKTSFWILTKECATAGDHRRRQVGPGKSGYICILSYIKRLLSCWNRDQCTTTGAGKSPHII